MMSLGKISFRSWSISLLVLVVLIPWFSLVSQVLSVFESSLILLWKEILVTLNIVSGVVLILTSRQDTKLSRFNQVALLSLPGITLLAIFWGFFRAFVYDLPTFNIFLGLRFEWFWLVWLVFYVWWYFFDQGGLFRNLQQLPIKFFSNSIIAGFLSQALLAGVFGQQKIIDLVSVFGQAGIIDSQVCNPIDFGIDVCRLQGVFNSPNHFAGVGLYALTLSLLKLSRATTKKAYIFNSLATFLILLAIYFSYSRYAWFGAGLIILTFVSFIILTKLKLWSLKTLKSMLVSQWVLSILAITVFLFGFSSFLSFLPGAVIKPSSSTEHVRHMQVARDIILFSPGNFWLGFGVGASGSASNPIYYQGDQADQNPIVKNHGQIPLQYGLFPHRASIPESWFLQVWLNGGLIYLIIYIILSFSPYLIFLSQLLKSKSHQDLIILTGFLSIIIGNLILHIWENQSISLGMTLLFLIFLGLNIKNSEDRSNFSTKPA